MKKYNSFLRSFRAFLLAAFLILGASITYGQTNVIVGTGITTSNYPLDGNWGYERSASLYASYEIGYYGAITKASWYPTSAHTGTLPVRILMKTVSSSVITADTWENMIIGATEVFNGSITVTPANAWFDINFTTPFNTRSSDNILVLIETNYGGTGSSTTSLNCQYSIATNMFACLRQDTSIPTGNLTVGDNRPNIRFTYNPSTAFLANPRDFIATPISSSQINLTWALDGLSDPVLLVYNTANTFGTPSGTYSAGNAVTGGGTVVYVGSNTAFNHTGLAGNTMYYYKIFSNNAGVYTPGAVASGHTPCSIASIPFFEGFESGYTDGSTTFTCYSQEQTGGYYWTANNTYTNYNRTPRTGSWNAYIHYSGDSWIFRDIQLTSGKNYFFSVFARQDADDATCGLIEVKGGLTPTSTGMTIGIIPSTGVVDGDYQQFTGVFTVPVTGVYYIGIHGILCSDPYYLSMDDINIVELNVTNPTSFTATPFSTSQMNLSWVLNSSGHDVMVAYSTANTFGTPTGTYAIGAPITGGGTVIYKGNATSFNQTGLNPNTTYYYKIWSTNSGMYSPGLTCNGTTFFGSPYSQNFNASTALPNGWTSDMAVIALHGTGSPATNGLAVNLDGTPSSAYATTPNFLSIPENNYFEFWYRIANYTYSYPPTVATVLSANEKIEIQVSTNNGTSFSTIYTINSTNHVTSLNFAKVILPLTAYAGHDVKIKILATYASGDYYLDIDDVKLYIPPAMTYVSSTSTPATGMVPSGSVDNVILGAQIVTADYSTPLVLNRMDFTTNGTTAPLSDISVAKLWSSGTSSNGVTVQIGTGIVSPNGAFSFTGLTTSLSNGTNYFWLTYDVPATAPNSDVLSATCPMINISGTDYVPTVTVPGSSRLIVAPLAGVYTINNTLPTNYPAGTNFNNFNEAANYLNSLGNTSGVTFNVSAGQTFNVVCPTTSGYNYALGFFTTGTASNPIIFQKFGEGANPVISATGNALTSDMVIWLAGVRYYTFDGINITDAGTAAANYVEYGYYLQGSGEYGVSNNTFKNCQIDLTKTNTSSRGIYSYTYSPTSISGTNHDNKFINNMIQDSYTGYYFSGNATYSDDNNLIAAEGSGSNVLMNIDGYGIYANYQTNLNIHHNTIVNTNSTASFYGIYVSSGTGNTVNIYNNSITGNTTTGSYLYGIYVSNALTASCHDNMFAGTASAAAIYGLYFGDAGTNTIYSNTVTGCTATGTNSLYGVYLTTGTSICYNNSITGLNYTNASTSYSVYGIYLSSGTNTVYSNTVAGLASTGNAYGLAATGGTLNNIYKNTIYSVSGSVASSVAYGISISSGTTHNVYNNYIYDIKAVASTSAPGVCGISLTGGTNDNIYYNTVYLDYTPTATTNSSAAIYASTSPTTIDLRDNIFINKAGAAAVGTRHVAYYRSSTALTTLSNLCNNNLFYAGVASAKNLIYYDGTNNDQTMVAMKARLTPRESQSRTEDVPFVSGVSPYDLHVQAVPTRVESGGQRITTPIAIGVDFDDNLRFGETGYAGTGLAPDIGADEGNFGFIDDVPPVISYTKLNNTYENTNKVFQATISDLTGVPTSGSLVPRVYYKKMFAGSWFSQPGVLLSGNGLNGVWSFTIVVADLGGIAINDSVYYYVIAQDLVATPNIGSLAGGVMAADVNNVVTPPAAPYGFKMLNALTGDYHIGVGKTYATITAAVADYHASFIIGPVRFLLDDATYTETFPITINKHMNTSATNTVTFKPNTGVNVLLSGSSTTSLILLNNANNIIFDGSNNGSNSMNWTLTNTATTGTVAVFNIASLGAGLGATNNIIKNCNINTGSNTISSYGISIGSTIGSSGVDNDYNTIQNNAISKAKYGIYIEGSSSDYNIGNVLSGNYIGGATTTSYVLQYGVQANYQDNFNVFANEVFNIISDLNSPAPCAFDMESGISNMNFHNNKIHDIVYTGASGYGAIGLNIKPADIANPNINIYNNVFYHLASDCDRPSWISTAIRVQGTATTTSGINIDNNSVYLTPDAIYGMNYENPTFAACIVLDDGPTGINLRNNILKNSLTKKDGSTIVPWGYAIFYKGSVNPFGTVNNNIYMADNNGTNVYVACVGGGNPPTVAMSKDLAAWRTFTGQDVNSKWVNPQYTGLTDLLPLSTSPAIYAGSHLATIATDILGNARNATYPTIGAYEIAPPVTITGGTISPLAYCVGTTVNIPFTTNAPTLPGNVFTAYINTETAPTAIGTLTANAAGTHSITGTLNVPPGSNYKIYVSSSTPASQGTDNGEFITVNALPQPVCGGNIDKCISDLPFALIGGTPEGGVYSGVGVSGGMFDPAVATVGTHTITYTVTENGCSGTCTFTVTVHALPIVNCAPVDPVCANAQPFMFENGSPAGGHYTGTGINLDGMFVPADANIGPNTITYTYADPVTGCTNTNTFDITVKAIPVVTPPSDYSVCIDHADITLAGGLPEGGEYSGDFVIDGVFLVAESAAGNHKVNYTVTNAEGCSVARDFVVEVKALPEVIAEYTGDPLCVNGQPIDLTAYVNIQGGTFTSIGSGVTGNDFDPAAAGVGIHEITYTYTDGTTNCTNSDMFSIEVKALTDVTVPADMTICIDEPIFDLTGATPVGGTYSGPGVYGNRFFPYEANVGAHTIKYSYSNEFGCENSNTFTITVVPLPIVNGPADFSVCSDLAPFVIEGCTPDNGSFEGTGIVNNFTGMFDPSAANIGENTITYMYFTPDGIHCANKYTFVITVNPQPGVQGEYTGDPLCVNGQSINLTPYTSPLGGTFAGVGVTGDLFDPSVAGAGDHVVTYTITDALTGCSNSVDLTIPVKDKPAVTCPANYTVCSNEEIALIPEGNPNTGTFSGLGVVDDYLFDPAIAPIGANTITYTVTNEFGCSNTCDFTITVFKALEPVCTQAATAVCADNGPLTLAGATPLGGEYKGDFVAFDNGNYVLDVEAAGAGDHSVTYEVISADGCHSTCEFTVTVKPLPDNVVAEYTGQPLCVDGSTIDLTPYGSPEGGTFTSTGAGVVDNTFNPAVAGVGSHELTYTYTCPETGCTNTDVMTIEVKPLPVITVPATITKCANDPLFLIPDGTPIGGEYTGTGVIGNNEFMPELANIGDNTITYRAHDEFGCENTNTFIIHVNAAPDITCPAPIAVCENHGLLTLTGGLPVGGTYGGQFVDPATSMFDVAAAAVAGPGVHDVFYTVTDPITLCQNTCQFTVTVNALPIIENLVNSETCFSAPPYTLTGVEPVGGTYTGIGVVDNVFSPAAAGIGTHTITYTYENPNTHCVNSGTFDIEVKTQPSVTCPQNVSVCVDVIDFDLTGKATPTGGTYSGDFVADNVFHPSVAGVGPHSVTYFYEVNGCSNTCLFEIQVNALPQVAAPDAIAVCADNGPLSLTDGTPVGGTFTGDYVTGNTFDVATAGAGDYTVTYTYTNGNGCSASDDFIVTVKPLPLVDGIYTGDPLCVDGADIDLIPYVYPAGGTFTGLGVVNGYRFDPKVALVGSHDVLYTYTDPQTNCTNTATLTIEVKPLPVVTAPQVAPVCANAPLFLIPDGTPVGGTYTGAAVIGNNEFMPEIAVIGNNEVTYTVIDEFGCTAFATFNIVVNDIPVVTCPQPISACDGQAPIELTGGLPVGGTYSGPAVANGFFSPESLAVGDYTLYYTYKDANNCEVTCSFPAVIHALPQVTCPTYNPVCFNAQPFLLTGGEPVGGTFTGAGVINNIFNPAAAGVGAHSIVYEAQNEFGCKNSNTFEIVVNELPDGGIFSVDPQICPRETAQIGVELLTNAIPFSYVYSVNGVETTVTDVNAYMDVFEVSPNVTTTYTLVSITDANGCTAILNKDLVITVNPAPVVYAMTSGTGCYTSAGYPLGLDGSEIGVDYTLYLFESPVQGPQPIATVAGTGSALPLGVYSTVGLYYVKAVNALTGCESQMSETFQITPLPVKYNVTGGGSYSQGGDGVEVGLDDSQRDVTYQLVLNGTPTSQFVDGTNDAISFGNQTAEGTYTVIASDDFYHCPNTMLGQAVVTINLAPKVYNVTGGGPYCEYGNGSEVGLDGSETGVEYQLSINSIPLPGKKVLGTGDPVTFGQLLLPGNYTVRAKNLTNLVEINMAGNAIITINPLPQVSLQGCTNLCLENSPITIVGSPVGGTFTSSTTGFDVATGIFDPAAAGVGVYDVNYLYTDANGCQNSASCQIEVYAMPVVTLANYPDVCGDTEAFELYGGLPEGGFYMGPSVQNNIFDPMTAGIGPHTITYIYQNENGCMESAEATINVIGRTITNNVVFEACQMAGSPVDVPYTVTCTFNQNNTFNAVLSHADGSFDDGGIVIGTVSATTDGTISCVLPARLQPSNLYRIRVESTSPAFVGDINATNLAIVGKPVVNGTAAVTGITVNSAVSGGNVVSDAYAPVNMRGVCWGTSPNPTIANNFTNDGAGTGTFVSNMTGLHYATKYYVRSYAMNCAGITYGTQTSFETQNYPPIVINLVDKTVCRGANMNIGNGVNTITGGSGQYQIAWKPTVYLNNATIMNPDAINPQYTQKYTVYVTDVVTGLTTKGSMTLNIGQIVTPTVAALTRVTAAVATVDLNSYVISPLPGTVGYIFNWFNNATPRVPVVTPGTPLVDGLNKFNLVLSNGTCNAPEKLVTIFRANARFSGENDEPIVSTNGDIVAYAYPTPTNGTLTLDVLTEGKQDVDVRILNLVGQEIFSLQGSSNGELVEQIDISNAAAGTYILMIKSGNETVSTKIIKY